MNNKAIELIGLGLTDEKYFADITDSEFFGFPIEPLIEAEEKLRSKDVRSIGYFSMEYGLAPSIYHTFQTKNTIDPSNITSKHEVFSNLVQMDYYHYLPVEKILDLPIYSGGLGVLAGDTLKSSADLGISLVGVGVLWHKGYFQQKFWFREGGQFPEELEWDPYSYPGLVPLDKSIEIELSGHKLKLKLWKYYVYSYSLKSVIPLVLLDANVPENPDYLRELTDQLYRSTNSWIKIAQRMLLGVGGMKALEALGYSIDKYHLNEGHAALAFVEKLGSGNPDELREKFAYTCHTPVEAGHDRFNFQELEGALGHEKTNIVRQYGSDEKNHTLANLTVLAMNTSGHINGVSKKHGEVTRLQFPNHRDRIASVTNGIHTFTWMSENIKNHLKQYKDTIGDFENDPVLLSNVSKLKGDAGFRRGLWDAHRRNKAVLSDFLKHWFFDKDVFTISWARRIANYKRPTLILQDVHRLVSIAKKAGPIQIILAGKAHPADTAAARFMDVMMEKINMLGGQRKNLKIAFLENYDTYFGKFLTSNVDVWLNNPLPPFEASGTSGMKAIANAVLQLSTLDGWIVEAADKNIGRVFGWVPKEGEIGSEDDLKLADDSKALYDNLEQLVTIYYDLQKGRKMPEESEWVEMMINCIEQSAYFSTHRMVGEYKQNIWGF